ncbi:MAG: NapC/NirT family cytochrome c [Bacteroidota bacterium]
MKLPDSYRNPVSILGTIIAIIAFVTIIILMVLTYYFKVGSVYFDLYTFIVVPVFLIGGLLLIAAGMFLNWRRRRKGPRKFPEINLNDKKQRNAAGVFIVVTAIFIIMTVFGTSEGIKYSESNEFCGTMCHKAMNPEYIAYHHGPHAEVECTECHVGEGVDYFVEAKISGMRQLYKYLTDDYDRPIKTPITSLRPASHTCEKCHWPQKFYTYYLRSENIS